MLSLCQGWFFLQSGSYATAILSTQFGWSFWATLPVAALVSALFGLLIGLPTLRLKGDYLAIATLGFGEIVRNVLNNWDSVTNGPMGIQKIPMPDLFGFTINPYRKYALLGDGHCFCHHCLLPFPTSCPIKDGKSPYCSS